jgi:hypothetical protein
MMKHAKLAAALGGATLLLIAAAPASARDLPNGGMTAHEIADWLQASGMSATVKPDPTTPGDQIISSSSDGVNWDIYLYACNGTGDARRCGSIQYAAGWSGLSNFDVNKVNDWDRDQRYIRSYRDNKGNAWGEYDVDISPGGTYEMLGKSLSRWREAITGFKKFIGQ